MINRLSFVKVLFGFKLVFKLVYDQTVIYGALIVKFWCFCCCYFPFFVQENKETISFHRPWMSTNSIIQIYETTFYVTSFQMEKDYFLSASKALLACFTSTHSMKRKFPYEQQKHSVKHKLLPTGPTFPFTLVCKQIKHARPCVPVTPW